MLVNISGRLFEFTQGTQTMTTLSTELINWENGWLKHKKYTSGNVCDKNQQYPEFLTLLMTFDKESRDCLNQWFSTDGSRPSFWSPKPVFYLKYQIKMLQRYPPIYCALFDFTTCFNLKLR
jgi:hypothetical protein